MSVIEGFHCTAKLETNEHGVRNGHSRNTAVDTVSTDVRLSGGNGTQAEASNAGSDGSSDGGEVQMVVEEVEFVVVEAGELLVEMAKMLVEVRNRMIEVEAEVKVVVEVEVKVVVEVGGGGRGGDTFCEACTRYISSAVICFLWFMLSDRTI